MVSGTLSNYDQRTEAILQKIVKFVYINVKVFFHDKKDKHCKQSQTTNWEKIFIIYFIN